MSSKIEKEYDIIVNYICQICQKCSLWAWDPLPLIELKEKHDWESQYEKEALDWESHDVKETHDWENQGQRQHRRGRGKRRNLAYWVDRNSKDDTVRFLSD